METKETYVNSNSRYSHVFIGIEADRNDWPEKILHNVTEIVRCHFSVESADEHRILSNLRSLSAG